MTSVLMVELKMIHVEVATKHLEPWEDSEHLVDKRSFVEQFMSACGIDRSKQGSPNYVK